MTFLLAILLTASAPAADLHIEAEDAELIGVEIDSTRAGYSGRGYVTGYDAEEDLVRFTFEIAEAGIYELRLGYAQSARIRPYDMAIGGEPAGGTLFGTQGSFFEGRLAEHWFAAGEHVVEISGGFDLDYLRLARLVYDPPEPPPFRLSDSQATPEARALMGFLLDMYGEKILSGQQDLSEIAYIERVTGKTPAIGAFDLIDYSPSRIEHGANPAGSSERWIDWAAQDGIVTLMWHWNAPTDLINEPPDRLWWSGFYTRATTFDLDVVLADPTSERYQLLLRDIDAIAEELRKFQDAGVPVLWRPLHEAAGGWFWWGAHGPEAFVQLWRLLYDRLVHEHDIHNLIWVYTHEPNAFDWYPGDAYVDVVSRDVYADDPRAVMRGDWEQLQEHFGDRMLVALSESGTLPDPQVITDYGIWWSWFAVWNGSFIRDIDEDYLNHVFQSEHVLTRDELPEWRSYPQPIDDELEPETALAFTIFPNPSAGAATVRLMLSDPAEVRVEVFDVVGRRVYVDDLGFRPAGLLEARLEAGEASGVYLVRVRAGEVELHRTLLIAK